MHEKRGEKMNKQKIGMILAGFAMAVVLLFCLALSAQAADMGEIRSGETRVGNITTEGQTDSFIFYGDAGQGVVIEMAAIDGDLGPAIYLYRPNGTVEIAAVGGSYDNRIRIEEHLLEQTGIYTIVVAASWGYYTSTTGEYGLSFTKIPSIPSPGVYNPFPANGATITNLNQSFKWDAVTGATGYDLYFGEDVITPLEKIGENLTSSELPFPAMEWNKVYYWHVEAHIPNGTIQGPYWWFKTKVSPFEKHIFDTGEPSNPYPSIFGTHNGTIKPNVTIEVSKLYTYPCVGTGGHTEFAKIWNNTGFNASAVWESYKGDWHNISFDKTFTLVKNETYNYTVRTGSYPQIHHAPALPTTNGWINCTQFIDANGKTYNNWIPAIRLFL
jgi:hypothetical protein